MHQIISELPIGNVLAINLRTPTLDFVTIDSQDTNLAVLSIDATDLQVGDNYSLIIESFDTASTVQSTLRKDTVALTIICCWCTDSTLSPWILSAGSPSTWTWSFEECQGDPLVKIDVVPRLSMIAFFTFDLY